MSYFYPVIESTTMASVSSAVPIISSARATTLATSYVQLYPRESKSSDSKSSKTSSSSSSKCTGDKQNCQTGTSTTGTTVGLSIGIPVFVFSCVIGFFLYRSYRKGKKEALDDNDPDFYGETTILPDYPKPSGPRDPNNPNISTGSFDQDDGISYYSNPFAGENARYPSNVMNQPEMWNQSQNGARSIITARGEPYFETFKLPYEHNTGSHHSLDEFAKGMGSEYPAYRMTSRPTSPYRSPNSSSVNLSSKNVRNLTEKTYSIEEPTTTDSSQSYRESKVNTESVLGDIPTAKDRTSAAETSNEGDDDDDEFQDSYDNLAPNRGITQSDHHRQNSDLSYVDEPEVLKNSFEKEGGAEVLLQPEEEEEEEELQHEIVQNKSLEAPTTVDKDFSSNSKGNSQEGDDEEEDEEDIKRMKSVYRVYFERENSVKRPAKVPQSEAPPLPRIDTENIDPRNTPEPEYIQEEYQENTPDSNIGLKQAARNGSNFLSVNGDEVDAPNPSSATAKHRAVSSIYSTIPLAQFDDQQQQQYQRYPQQQYQQFPQQQRYQPQYAQGQPQYQQYPQEYSQPSSPLVSQTPQFTPQPLKPLQSLPTPNKMDYNSVVTQTDYAPKKSLTTGAKPELTIKPFNPLHYSDQIFTPTSPISPSQQQFSNMAQQSQSIGSNDGSVPSPHHIRQSIVMVNPVEIGKQKIYRPAGAFSSMNSANSSRNGSMTSQSNYTSQHVYQAPSSAELPRSGSQADLRKQLGASDNYNFV